MSESWKSSPTVFQKQLDLNLRYFKTGIYPPHWYAFLIFLHEIQEKYPIRSILDIGCGCGACYGLLKKECPTPLYIGVDFAAHAIDVAKKHWGVNQFFVKSLWDLTETDIDTFDLVYCDALFEVMNDADQALKFFMAIRPRLAIINRVSTHDFPSYYKTYTAYDEIQVYGFTHNRQELLETLKGTEYDVEQHSTTYLVRRHDVQTRP